MSKFGENLDYLIDDNNLSPQTLALQIGIDSSLIYKYLRKEILPTTPNLILICDFFSCSVDAILGLAVENSKIRYKKAPLFCTRFQSILKEKNLSRYKFIKDSKNRNFHFAKQSVDDWYHGKRYPTVDNAVALSKYFDCTLDHLFGRDL